MELMSTPAALAEAAIWSGAPTRTGSATFSFLMMTAASRVRGSVASGNAIRRLLARAFSRIRSINGKLMTRESSNEGETMQKPVSRVYLAFDRIPHS
jgi:hypothetical protein